ATDPAARPAAPPRRARRPSRSLLQEGQPVLADLQLVAVRELGALDAPPVHERPVETALVLDHEALATGDEDRWVPRDGDVVEEDVAVGRAADRSALVARNEVLTRPASARAHDERRA